VDKAVKLAQKRVTENEDIRVVKPMDMFLALSEELFALKKDFLVPYFGPLARKDITDFESVVSTGSDEIRGVPWIHGLTQNFAVFL